MTLTRDPSHPRPHLQRPGWRLLDGEWDFALDPDARWSHPSEVAFDGTINVPFAPETPASGVAFDGFLRRCFYRTVIEVEPLAPGERAFVRFGAVDREARVWANGSMVGSHTGGYTPFGVDVTDAIDADGRVEIVVRADDQPRTLTIPRGKQDWQEKPHIIWYPRTTGIWQSVWLERVPAAHVESIRWEGDPATMSVALTARLDGVASGDTLRVVLRRGDRVLADDAVGVTDVLDGSAIVSRTFVLGAPGIDDAFALVWRPSTPALIEATLTLDAAAGTDTVASYAALRSVAVEHGRVTLNGRPTVMRLALDQGYWPDSGMTAPSVDALRRDVELIRELGLDGVRKHQKVEDPRWLAFCDEMGVLVWEELPSAYPFSYEGAAALTREWTEVIERDRNHPCIVAWVPMNESWGVPDAPHRREQRALVEGLAQLTRALDPTRLVSANDGWETAGGDVVGIHDYEQDAARLRERYATAASVDALADGFGPERRALTLDGPGVGSRAVLLTEMGGATFSAEPSELFGYGNVTSEADYVARVRDLCAAVLSSDVLSGYCWTQLTDTYQEANGLLRMDRTPKAPIADLCLALLGWPAP